MDSTISQTKETLESNLPFLLSDNRPLKREREIIKEVLDLVSGTTLVSLYGSEKRVTVLYKNTNFYFVELKQEMSIPDKPNEEVVKTMKSIGIEFTYILLTPLTLSGLDKWKWKFYGNRV